MMYPVEHERKPGHIISHFAYQTAGMKHGARTSVQTNHGLWFSSYW